jgi:uncharacterized protein GlcG (DUF336 family)
MFDSVPVTQTRAMFLTKPSISAAGAQKMIDAVTAAAERQHKAVTVVVVDEGGSLIAMKRMDGANVGSLQAAMAKAVTAAKLGLPTGTFLEDGQPNMPVATAFISAGFTLLAGGQPIKIKGDIIGAIAVSGTGDDKAYIRSAMQAIGL